MAERISQGTIPIRDALSIARQIVEALECAHDHGIVHRDLKPGNIKLRKDGTVKVLDFGLAAFLSPESVADVVEQATTASDPTSRPGAIIGTLAYMSPEQARGSQVDQRADIWAFGVVLYEMLSGRRAFPGLSSSDVIAAIMKEYPDWTVLPQDTPPSILRLLRRCLAKDTRDRLHAIADARLEIEGVVANSWSPESAKVRSIKTSVRPSRVLPWALLGLAVTAIALVWWSASPRHSALKPSARFSFLLPSEAPLAPASAMPLAVGRSSVALSPDGTRLS